MRSNLAHIGQEAALLEERAQDSGAGPGGPAGSGVGGPGCSDVRVHGDGQSHPLQPPLGASGARFAGLTLRVWTLAAGWTPVLPTRYTHPVPTYPYPSQAPTDADTVPTTGSTVTTGMHIWLVWDRPRRT